MSESPSLPVLLPGHGTCQVYMINTGLLDPGEKKSDYVDTKETTAVCLPVMCFVIEHGEKTVLWVSFLLGWMAYSAVLVGAGEGVRSGEASWIDGERKET